MCRGIIKTGTARVAQITGEQSGAPASDCPNLKNGLCADNTCMSTIHSLLVQDESLTRLPVFLPGGKQPAKCPPPFLSKLSQPKLNSVPAPAPTGRKEKAAKTAPKPLRAEAEYILGEEESIQVVRVDTYRGFSLSSVAPEIEEAKPVVSQDVPSPKEPWQVALDGFGDESATQDLPCSRHGAEVTPENEVSQPMGDSLIAQLLSTKDSVREVYKKIEKEDQREPPKLSPHPPPLYLYDSGYDDSPTSTVFDPSESPPLPDEMKMDFQQIFHQLSPAPKFSPLQQVPDEGLDFLLTHHRGHHQGPPPEVQTGTFPPVPRDRTDPVPAFSPLSGCNWTMSPPLSLSSEIRTPTSLEFEPTAPFWEKQVFSSSPIFPQAPSQQRNSLDLESELMLVESFFDPSMNLRNVAF